MSKKQTKQTKKQQEEQNNNVRMIWVTGLVIVLMCTSFAFGYAAGSTNVAHEIVQRTHEIMGTNR